MELRRVAGERRVFVIMPFSEANTRRKGDLDFLFAQVIKRSIEEVEYTFSYQVTRSDDAFDITTAMLRRIYEADIVIADLSGSVPNPNVMFELGVRLASSNGFVILIRENNATNRPIFDTSTFFTFYYSTEHYDQLQEHLTSQIRRYENNQLEWCGSPVLNALERTPDLNETVKYARGYTALDNVYADFRTLLHNALLTAAWFVEERAGRSSPKVILEDERTWDEFFEKMAQIEHECGGLPWKEFGFEIQSLPAITQFICERPLRGILPDRSEMTLSFWLREYWAVFAGTNATWRHFNYSAFETLIGDGLVLTHVFRALLVALGLSAQIPDGNFRRHADAAIYETYKHARLRKSKLIDLFESTEHNVFVV